MFNIEALKGLGEPLKSFNYEVFIPQIPGGGINGANVSFYVDAASIPASGTEQVSVFAGGHELRYAGRGLYSHEWPVGFRLYENQEIMNMLWAWHEQQWDRLQGTMRTSEEYKTTLYLKLATAEGGIAHQFRILGGFIANMGEVPLNPDNSQVIIIPVTFAFDYFVKEF